MWETYRLPLSGNFSLRKIALTLIAALLSALFVATVNSTTTFADNATWEGEAIKYQNNSYTRMSPAPASLPGITPENNTFYQYQQGDEISIIAVKENPDKTKELADAQLGTFLRDAAGNYTPRAGPITLTINADPAATATGTGNGTTSCAVEGVGWIICHPSRWIAGGMDKVYDWLNGFLTVKPLTTDTSSGLYTAWEIARGIANACFILAFLFIIYSHITSYGISNYEIKKMIPKLIVAAVLVNVSYYICAVAVDFSNILGDSVQQALIEIRNTIAAAGESGGTNWLSWENVTEYILSGGALAVAGKVGIGALLTATGGSATSLIFLLFPILVAGLLSVLVALAILAARQAIITVLIVISPLAFVAYLLPNTEKWFEKWRGLFTTMLLVFPLFSLLFGGSQLASALIIQNADQASVVILALFIQVAPLVVTPFLIQFSGSLLGRFAGMVNNPNKGLIDRTRNWSKERADIHAGRAQAAGEYIRNPLSTRRAAFKRDMGRRHREAQKALYDAQGDAAWANDSREHQLAKYKKYSELRTAVGHAESERGYEHELSRNNVWQHNKGRELAAQAAIKNYQTRTATEWDEAGANDMLANNRFAAFHGDATAQAQQAQVLGYRQGTAQVMQKIDYANALTAGNAAAQALAAEAAGIDTVTGPDSARAAAVNVLKKSKLDSIAEGRALYQHYNLNSSQRQALAKGISVTGIDEHGNTRTFTAQDSEYVRLAAVEDQITQGTLDEAIELIMKTGYGRELYEHREIVLDAMVKGGVNQKAAILGGKTMDDIRQGKLQNTNDLYRSALTTIAKGKLSPEVLLNQDKTSMEIIVKAIGEYKRGQVMFDGEHAFNLDEELKRLYSAADRAMTDPRINVRLGERAGKMQELSRMR